MGQDLAIFFFAVHRLESGPRTRLENVPRTRLESGLVRPSSGTKKGQP